MAGLANIPAKERQTMAKEKVVEEVVEVAHVTEHLDVDPNDPRVVNPTVDGNSQPKVDINEPA